MLTMSIRQAYGEASKWSMKCLSQRQEYCVNQRGACREKRAEPGQYFKNGYQTIQACQPDAHSSFGVRVKRRTPERQLM